MTDDKGNGSTTKRTNKKAELDRLLGDAREAIDAAADHGLSEAGIASLLMANECTLRSRMIVERMKDGFVTEAIAALVDQTDQRISDVYKGWV